MAEPAMAEAEGADAPVDQIETPAAADEPAPPEPEAKKPATKLKKKSTKKATPKKKSIQCSGSMKPVWYTNKDGKRKYRCRRSLY